MDSQGLVQKHWHGHAGCMA